MRMNTIRIFVLGFMLLAFAAPVLRAQDLSKYREFSLGSSVSSVLKRTDKKAADVKATQNAPDNFQEVNWWPPSLSGASYRSDSVEQVLFSFYKGELYKISVTYDQSATEGLTTKDMVDSISAKYGHPTSVEPEATSALTVGYDTQQKAVATWEDSQFSFNLVHYSFTSSFSLVIFAKQANTDAEVALVEAAKMAKQDAPAREAQRQKKQTEALELTRQKNQKSFRP